MNMTKWIDNTINLEKKKAMPVLSFPAIQKMDITVAELIGDSDKQCQAMKIIADLTDSAATVSFMDLSIEAEAFGSEIRVADDEVPTVIGSIISTEEEADAVTIPQIGDGRTKINIEAIEKVSKIINDRPVFAGIIGPFSLAGRLLDVSEAMIYCYEEPEMVECVLEKATAFLIYYCKAYKSAGADGVVMAEPLAGLLSPDLAEDFSAKYVRQIVNAVQDDDFIVIYHNCGNSVPQTIDTIVNNGCKVFHFGNAIDLSDILKFIPNNALVMGNVDPAGQIKNGTAESVYKVTQEILTKCSGNKNFVISSGCDIPPMSPWENIEAFFKAVSDFYS